MPDDDRPMTLPAALALTASLLGGNPAYVAGGRAERRALTWADVSAQAVDFAAGLVALGLNAGDRVAICAENSVEWVIACHGILLAGGVIVPVYYDLKQQEIGEQIRRPECRFVVASDTTLSKIPERSPGLERIIVAGEARREGRMGFLRRHAAETMPFEAVPAAATSESRQALPGRAPGPDNLAAVIYTSGSTGGAKGVMLSHRNFMANGHSVLSTLDISGSDSVLLVLPLHHALPFIAAVVLVCLVGARVVIENDIRRVRDRMADEKPTIFFGVPALYDIMYRNVLARAEAEGRLATLQGWQPGRGRCLWGEPPGGGDPVPSGRADRRFALRLSVGCRAEAGAAGAGEGVLSAPGRVVSGGRPAVSAVSAPAAVAERIGVLPWDRVSSNLDGHGCAVLERLLAPESCEALAALYPDDGHFRSRVVMGRHGFGRGEYKYFGYPLPEIIADLRTALYARLSPVANRWNEALGLDVRYPAAHSDFLARCHSAGQRKPTPLLLQYGPDDFNCLHQDLYGEHVFPIQVAILLSEPGRDFSGGEFVLTEQRPRMQSRAEVVPLRQGDAVAFAVHHRPVQGTRGVYRVNLRHGVSRIRSGRRHTAGIIFHDGE